MNFFLQSSLASGRLVSAARQVLFRNWKLLLFPLLLIGGVAVVAALFLAAPVLQAGGSFAVPREVLTRVMDQLGRALLFDRSFGRLGYAYAPGLYLAVMFTGTFINVAYCHEIMAALSGEPVSIRRGLAFACRRLPAILAWSVTAWTVGLVIRAAERNGWIGGILARYLGVAWSVASIFVIPVMLRESSPNPLVLLRASATTLKHSWSEGVIGYGGLFAGILLPLFAWVLAVGLAMGVAAWFGSGALVLAAIAVGVLGLVTAMFLFAISKSVFHCALYIYATEGVVPGPFTTDQMDPSWRVRAANIQAIVQRYRDPAPPASAGTA
jgi:hypothetical protein